MKKAVGVLMLLFAAVYYIGRIAISIAGVTGGMAFEEEQTAVVETVVTVSFLMIGLVGLAMLPGIYLRRLWGFYGTVAVSFYTIAFDLWAFALVQSSAIAGVVPAGIILGYCLFVRKEFVSKK